jgi:pyruvate dehydrogenase E2 component (dihydrolipoamide acetyltransferase)
MLIQVPQNVPGLKNATVRRWLKKVGEGVRAGDILVELDTEDALVQLQAPADGSLGAIAAEAGKTLGAGAELARFETGSNAKESVVPQNGASAAAAKASSSPAGSGVPILMPQAGNTMEEGTILKWRVKVGDAVTAGQVICEVETDKATIEVESTEAGKVAWLAAEGSAIPVKQPIAILGDAPLAAAPSGPTTPAAAASSAPPSAPPAGGVPSGTTPILMPQAGNTMEEGTIVKWRVKVGDAITVGQVICDIETDKATVEMESTDAGKVAWLAAEGSVIAVKQPIALLGDAPVAAPAFGVPPSGGSKAAVPAVPVASLPPKGGTTSVAAPAAVAANNGGRLKVSPAARKIAIEKNIDLAGVGAGSGPGGRILSTDLADLKARSKTAMVAAAALPPKGGTPNIAAAGPMGELSGGRKALSKMRKAIAVNLQTSKQTVPHFYIRQTINADPLFAFYKAQKPATGCTLNDVMLLAVGRVVGEFAGFRSRLEGNEIVETPAANIGVAVSVPDGLVVPVVLNVHAMTLAQLAVEAKRVVESARNGKIENMGKGVFTISNMGMLGVEDFAAIINPPESGILAISGVREAVIVKDGAMRAGRVMALTLSVDHRVVDGALAAQWMGRLRDLLENPEKLLG